MTTRGENKALEIAQGLLDRTGAALMSGDPADFVPCFRLPHVLNTFDRERVIETEAQLVETFRLVSTNYREEGITDLVRIVISAVFIAEDEIHQTDMSHWMEGAQRVAEPFPSYSVITYREGRWAIAHSEYAIPDDLRLARTLAQAGTPT